VRAFFFSTRRVIQSLYINKKKDFENSFHEKKKQFVCIGGPWGKEKRVAAAAAPVLIWRGSFSKRR